MYYYIIWCGLDSSSQPIAYVRCETTSPSSSAGNVKSPHSQLQGSGSQQVNRGSLQSIQFDDNDMEKIDAAS
jgi:hypothetical protein